MRVKSIPDEYHTLTPYLLAEDAQVLIDFLHKAFNAITRESIRNKEGKIGHAV